MKPQFPPSLWNQNQAVVDKRPRHNNFMESNNAKLQSLIKQKPTVWDFLLGLRSAYKGDFALLYQVGYSHSRPADPFYSQAPFQFRSQREEPSQDGRRGEGYGDLQANAEVGRHIGTSTKTSTGGVGERDGGGDESALMLLQLFWMLMGAVE